MGGQAGDLVSTFYKFFLALCFFIILLGLVRCSEPLDQSIRSKSQDAFRTKPAPLTWTLADQLPLEGRSNPFNLSATDFLDYQAQGQIHTQVYPVEVTGVLLPERPIK